MSIQEDIILFFPGKQLNPVLLLTLQNIWGCAIYETNEKGDLRPRFSKLSVHKSMDVSLCIQTVPLN